MPILQAGANIGGRIEVSMISMWISGI